MEDPKPVPTPPSNPSPASDLPQTEKRNIEDAELYNSNFMKIRTIIKDLRPSFIEVLHASDFRNCKAANDIRKQMQVVMELSKQLGKETVSPANIKKEGQPLVSENQEVSPDRRQEEKVEQPQSEKVPDKATAEEGLQASYVIGGSPVGWNFMMYPGSNAVYYGESKASFVARQVKSSPSPGS